jgi:hypothetical protein
MVVKLLKTGVAGGGWVAVCGGVRICGDGADADRDAVLYEPGAGGWQWSVIVTHTIGFTRSRRFEWWLNQRKRVWLAVAGWQFVARCGRVAVAQPAACLTHGSG